MTAAEDAIDKAAAAWDARLRGATTCEDHRNFEIWLNDDPAHQRAHDRLQAALRALRSHADLPELSAMRDEARQNVMHNRQRRIVSYLSVATAVAATILLFFVMPPTGLGSGVLADRSNTRIYATAPGAHSKVTLDDGSVVTLDAATRLAVQIGPTRRDVALLGGRALFKVAKDRRRPFVVTAAGRSITALGTVFDVRLNPRELRVTLAEGSVAVRAQAGGGQQLLRPRQQLIAVNGAAAPTLRTVDLDNALAWADRQLFFDDEPLASAIDEMNRHADARMFVAPDVADLRINGMFRISNQAGFVAALEATLPVDVRRDAQGRLVVTRRPAKGADI